MSQYIELTPVDTLFFRGNTPMEAGQINTASEFPPKLSVLQGAMWTCSCNENGKKFKIDDFSKKGFPFEIEGFFIEKKIDGKNKFYVNAPSNWYYEADEKVKSGKELNNKGLVISKNFEKLFMQLGVKSSFKDVMFVKSEKEAFSLNGTWIDVEFILSKEKTFSDNTVLFASDVYSMENRTGIAIDSARHVKEGQIYTATHVRLHDDISMIIKVSDNLGLSDSGKIMLGGEKRICRYKKITCSEIDNLFQKTSDVYINTVNIKADPNITEKILCTQKFQISAGWDLEKGFHKPTVNWIPGGTVFSEKINNSCIALTK